MVEELKENLETRLRSELVVEVPVGFLGFLEDSEFHNLLLHV
jgi:precorrin isomerase